MRIFCLIMGFWRIFCRNESRFQYIVLMEGFTSSWYIYRHYDQPLQGSELLTYIRKWLLYIICQKEADKFMTIGQ